MYQFLDQKLLSVLIARETEAWKYNTVFPMLEQYQVGVRFEKGMATLDAGG